MFSLYHPATLLMPTHARHAIATHFFAYAPALKLLLLLDRGKMTPVKKGSSINQGYPWTYQSLGDVHGLPVKYRLHFNRWMVE
jgi:hypothetical protein